MLAVKLFVLLAACVLITLILRFAIFSAGPASLPARKPAGAQPDSDRLPPQRPEPVFERR